MTLDRDDVAATRPHLAPALRLHEYLVRNHLVRGALTGPDSGIRLNYGAGRFVKGYLRFVRWHDDYAYLQTQGYWVLANWRLADLTGDRRYDQQAVAASRWIVAHQRADGSWVYPNREWAGRVATAEGTWAGIGLVETYRRTGDRRFLASARRWFGFLERDIGFQPALGGIAANYFAGRPGPAVPNNSAFVLRFLAALAATGDGDVLEHAAGLVRFLAATQRRSGELPYAVSADGGGTPHFQCVQYNAFQAIDLVEYQRTTGDPSVPAIVDGLLGFVDAGADGTGRAYYDCRRSRRAVVYHTAVRAAALALGPPTDRGRHRPAARTAYGWLLGRQRPDGSFPFSVREHGILDDPRPYPRNLAMILLHLLAPGR